MPPRGRRKSMSQAPPSDSEEDAAQRASKAFTLGSALGSAASTFKGRATERLELQAQAADALQEILHREASGGPGASLLYTTGPLRRKTASAFDSTEATALRNAAVARLTQELFPKKEPTDFPPIDNPLDPNHLRYRPRIEDDRSGARSMHTPLHLAVLADDLEMAAALLSRRRMREEFVPAQAPLFPLKIERAPPTPKMGEEDILTAALRERFKLEGSEKSDEEEVRLKSRWLDDGPEAPYIVDVPTADGRTPLHLASELGSLGMIALLLRYGASVSSTNAMRQTPLHFAVRCGHADSVKELLIAGAPATAADDTGETPAHYAVRLAVDPAPRLSAKYLEFSDLTVNDPRARTKKHTPEVRFPADPVRAACEIVETLSIFGPPGALSCTNRAGNTPLHLLARAATRPDASNAQPAPGPAVSEEVQKILGATGALKRSQPVERTPLGELAMTLARCGASSQVANERNETAMSIAVYNSDRTASVPSDAPWVADATSMVEAVVKERTYDTGDVLGSSVMYPRPLAMTAPLLRGATVGTDEAAGAASASGVAADAGVRRKLPPTQNSEVLRNTTASATRLSLTAVRTSYLKPVAEALFAAPAAPTVELPRKVHQHFWSGAPPVKEGTVTAADFMASAHAKGLATMPARARGVASSLLAMDGWNPPPPPSPKHYASAAEVRLDQDLEF